MLRLSALLLLTGCFDQSSSGRGLVLSTTFTISDSGGQGPSHLDVLAGRVVSFTVIFDKPVEDFPSVGGCPTNEWVQPAAKTSATGDSAAMVKTEILDYLPEWRARLSLCDVATQSSVQLSSDNFMNTGFTIGCIGLPAAAMQRDGAGNPKWTQFTAPSCTMQILDADTNRVMGARDFQLEILELAHAN